MMLLVVMPLLAVPSPARSGSGYAAAGPGPPRLALLAAHLYTATVAVCVAHAARPPVDDPRGDVKAACTDV